MQTQNTSTSTSSYPNTSQTPLSHFEIPKTEIKAPKAEKIFKPILGVETQALVKRAFIFMDDDNVDEAERYLEQALRQDPENSSAYIGKLMIELKVHNMDELSNISSSLKEQKLFQSALKFANDEEKIKLEYCLEVNEKNLATKKQVENEHIYVKVLAKKETISSSFDAQNIINLLMSIVPYKDSETIIQELEQKKAEFETLERSYMNACVANRKNNIENLKNPDIEKFNRVAEMFEALGDYKDCKSLAEEIRRSGVERVEKAKRDKKIRKLMLIFITMAIIGAGAFYAYIKISEQSIAKRAEQARIEVEKNEEKSRIEALKLELQNRKSNENRN